MIKQRRHAGTDQADDPRPGHLFSRIAGCYIDKDGDFEGSFNTNFLKLSAAEKTKKAEAGEGDSLFRNKCKP